MKEIIDCIPSAALREYLSVHPLKLSVLQKATIVDRYAKRKKQIAIFRKLLKEAKFRGRKVTAQNSDYGLGKSPRYGGRLHEGHVRGIR